jgi:hypothetical protein
MSYLLRRTRRAVWVGEDRSREAAAQELSRTDQDTDGISLFEVTNDEERLTIVAAIACARENCDRVDVIEVERDAVERYGRVDRTPDKGMTPVPEANRFHCSLDWDAAALLQLAEGLFDAGTAPREFDRTEVRWAVRSLDPGKVVGESAQAFVRAEQARPLKPRPR